MYVRTAHPHAAYRDHAIVPYSTAELDAVERRRERWALMRAGRWQGAVAVIAFALFWRFFLLAGVLMVALGAIGRRRYRRSREATDEGERWRRKRRSKRKKMLGAEPMLIGEAHPDELVEQSYREMDDQDREHREALADFDRRLARSMAR